jgi:hypothetical protein
MLKSARKVSKEVRKTIKQKKRSRKLYIDNLHNLGKLFAVVIALMFFYFPLIGIKPFFNSDIKIQTVQAESPKDIYVPPVPNEERRRVRTDIQPYEATEAIKKKICVRFGKYCREALVISLYESGWYANARSYADSRGVFQIHCPAHKKKVQGDCNKLYDIDTNIEIAYGMFVASGYRWYPWDVKAILDTPTYREFIKS